MGQFHIYQTDSKNAFRSWERTKKEFSIKEYKRVYSGELIDKVVYGGKEVTVNKEDIVVLEDLFEKFNLEKPEDYKARSMSVSDVVQIVRKNKKTWYYCDRFGFEDITKEVLEDIEEVDPAYAFTWDELCERAMDKGCLHPHLRAKDAARWQVRCIAMEHGKPDLDKAEIPEDMVEGYCKEYQITFDGRGNIYRGTPDGR